MYNVAFKEKFLELINGLSRESLMNLVKEYRSQVSAGIMCNKDARDRINSISVVLMAREMEERKGVESEY
jgi:hypothetical protein